MQKFQICFQIWVFLIEDLNKINLLFQELKYFL